MVDELGLAEKVVRHTYFIPTSAVNRYFGAADLVVQPYRSATQSGISQLAYHFGKPMVVTPVGGLPEIVPHGEAGYVVDPDPTAIADAILDFFDNERAADLTAGVIAGKSRFSWASMVEGIESLCRHASLEKGSQTKLSTKR
jgi:glycosyltransferase involved in cell wall biosynthesis